MSPEISEHSFGTGFVRETPPPYRDTPPGGYRMRKPEDYETSAGPTG